MLLLAQGRQIAADATESGRLAFTAKGPGNLLLHFDHQQVPFGLIVSIFCIIALNSSITKVYHTCTEHRYVILILSKSACAGNVALRSVKLQIMQED